MIELSIALAVASLLSLILGLVLRRGRSILIITSFFTLLNSYIAAPLNWASLLRGYAFRLDPISPSNPPLPVNHIGLPSDAAESLVKKMGCHVCHKIPLIPESQSSSLGPILILQSTAAARLKSPEYQARLEAGMANARTPREYLVESILKPDAFIVPGYENEREPGRSPMYAHYGQRLTPGGLETLVDFLMELDVDLAVREGMIVGH